MDYIKRGIFRTRNNDIIAILTKLRSLHVSAPIFLLFNKISVVHAILSMKSYGTSLSVEQKPSKVGKSSLTPSGNLT